jgi:anti-anti-sigma factor
MLQVNYNAQGQVFTLMHRKRLDFLVAREVKTAILRSVSRNYKNIALDLSGVSFIDSTAFIMLLELKRILNGSGYVFCLANVSDDAKELMGLGPWYKELSFCCSDTKPVVTS